MSNEITYEFMRRSVGGTAGAAADPIARILISPVLPLDVKAQLSDKALRERIASRCNELLRQVRAKIGRHRTKYDTDEARAAVVLEFVLRTGLPDDGRNSSSTRAMTVKAVPLGVLAAQVGVRKEFAEDTQRALGHYLNDAAEVVGGRRENKRPGSALNNTDARAGSGMSSSGGPTRHRNAGNESNVAMAAARGIVVRSLQQPETIRDLSISLGSMVEDADGSARRGEALFETLGQHIINSANKFSQKALLSDLQRNKSAYEAACFYLSVNDAEGAGGGLAKKKSNDTKAAGTGHGTRSDEEEERILSISNVMDAAKLGNKKDFEEIVRGVVNIAAEIRMQRAANIEKDRKESERAELRSSAANSSMKNGAKRANKRQRGDSKKNERSGQILPQDILVAADEKEWNNNISNSGANPASKHSARSLPAFVPSAVFLEWKKQTLNDAIAKARRETWNDKMTKQEALEWAVKGILSQDN